MRHGDHFIALAYAARHQRQLERIGAVGTRNGMPRSAKLRKIAFKRVHHWAADERRTVDHVADGGFDFGPQFIVLGTQINKRNLHGSYLCSAS